MDICSAPITQPGGRHNAACAENTLFSTVSTEQAGRKMDYMPFPSQPIGLP